MTYLGEVKARYEAATEGPWFAQEGPDPDIHLSDGTWITNQVLSPGAESDDAGQSNATFIANAREDMPWLVGIMERMIPMLVWVANFSGHPTASEEAIALLKELEEK